MSFSTPFIERPIATTLLMIAVTLLGLVCVPQLPIAPLVVAIGRSMKGVEKLIGA